MADINETRYVTVDLDATPLKNAVAATKGGVFG